MRSLIAVGTLILFFSCKTPRYYTPPVYAPIFANQFETQASGSVGSNGYTTKTGFATTKNITVGGTYNSNQAISRKNYYSREGEALAGFQFKLANGIFFAVHSGSGFGSSHRQNSGKAYKDFQGNITRPFGIITFGTARTSREFRVHGDFSFSLKTSYLMYRGTETRFENGLPFDVEYNPEHLIFEPYFNGNVGGKYVRFEYGMGFAMKRIVEAGKGMRVFPFQMNFGISFFILRRYDAKTPDLKKE